MKKFTIHSLVIVLLILCGVGHGFAATEQMKMAAIDTGLVWLAQHQVVTEDEGYWPYNNDGTLAATASAALAFIEEGWLPGTDFEMDGAHYGDVVGRAVRYILNRAQVDSRFGVETAGYLHYAEDYNNDDIFTNDDGNNQAIYFYPGYYARNVYTTGLCVPVVFALGESLGKDTVIGMGSAAVIGMTWAQLMQDLVDWFSWAQVEPNRGNYRGGWRYDANWSDSDNSTAQWGALPYLYADSWGLGSPQYVRDELALWADYIQNHGSGGSGYSNPTQYVNVSKTGGLLLELAVIGRPVSDPSVQAAINFINTRWNTTAYGRWYGNFNHPYTMWAVYKGLSVYGLTDTVMSLGEPILIGTGIDAAVGGYQIGFAEDAQVSAEDDWYSHYCQYLVDSQNADGSWIGYQDWNGALATGWYINILKATTVPPPVDEVYVDIKPTSCPNPVNAKSNGVLPVAILGSRDIDVIQIDPASIALAGVAPILSVPDEPDQSDLFGEDMPYVPPLRNAFEDVATPYTGELVDCMSCSTDGPDGYLDMTLKFDTQEVVAAILAGLPEDFVLTNRFCVEVALTFVMDGQEFTASDVIRLMFADGWEPDVPAEPDQAAIVAVSPNPFNPITKISYSTTRDGKVEVAVFDVAGRKIETLVSGFQTAGPHDVTWDAGRQASGVYLMRLQTGDQTFVKRITLVK